MRRGGAFLHSGSPLRCRLNFSILGLGDMKLAGPREVRTSKARLPGFGTLWAARLRLPGILCVADPSSFFFSYFGPRCSMIKPPKRQQQIS